MRCDECEEQVLDLIEREALDPEGVHEILARCPDCREAFDVLKVAIALSAQIPMEQPAASSDAAVLHAAAEHARGTVRRRRRRQAPPWAMAAIALLAVGVGVWAIPRSVQLEGDAAPSAGSGPGEAITAEQIRAAEPKPEEAKPDDAAARSELAASGEALGAPSAKRAVARAKTARSEPVPANRQLRAPEDEAKALQSAEAPASPPAADMAAGAPTAVMSTEAERAGGLAEDRDDQAKAACRRKVRQIERRARETPSDAPEPEELLAIGKCYQALGNGPEARKWLTRATTYRETSARAREALRELESR